MTSVKYAELHYVTDATRYKSQGSEKAAKRSAARVANMVDVLYNVGSFSPPLRVFLVGQTVFTSSVGDPYDVKTEYCSSNTCVSNIEQLLHKFTDWSGQSIGAGHSDVRQLLSGYYFKNNVLGVAWLGQLCNEDAASVIQAVPNIGDAFLATISAHELGHNFGMQHDQGPATIDGVNYNCPDSGYIMGKAASGSLSQWSVCSKEYYRSLLKTYPVLQICLQNVPVPYSEGVCGDGVRDSGEDCDCGSTAPNGCDGIDECCDARTCRLKTGSSYQCSDQQPCCSGCKFIPKDFNRLCRSSRHATCDQAEYCDGEQGDCPVDVYASAGTACSVSHNSGTYSGLCYKGTCPTLDGFCPIVASLFHCGGQSGASVCAGIKCKNNSGEQALCFQPTNTTSNTPIPTPDGTQCGTLMQCVAGACVHSSSIDGGSIPLNPSNTDTLAVVIVVCVISGLLAIFFLICFYRKFCKNRPAQDQQIGAFRGNAENGGVVLASGFRGGDAFESQPPRAAPGHMSEDLQMSLALQRSADEYAAQQLRQQQAGAAAAAGAAGGYPGYAGAGGAGGAGGGGGGGGAMPYQYPYQPQYVQPGATGAATGAASGAGGGVGTGVMLDSHSAYDPYHYPPPQQQQQQHPPPVYPVYASGYGYPAGAYGPEQAGYASYASGPGGSGGPGPSAGQGPNVGPAAGSSILSRPNMRQGSGGISPRNVAGGAAAQAGGGQDNDKRAREQYLKARRREAKDVRKQEEEIELEIARRLSMDEANKSKQRDAHATQLEQEAIRQAQLSSLASSSPSAPGSPPAYSPRHLNSVSANMPGGPGSGFPLS